MLTNKFLMKVVLISMAIITSACSLYPIEVTENIAHFNIESPSLNSFAPGFILKNVNGEEIELTGLIGTKPVVLQIFVKKKLNTKEADGNFN